MTIHVTLTGIGQFIGPPDWLNFFLISFISSSVTTDCSQSVFGDFRDFVVVMASGEGLFDEVVAVATAGELVSVETVPLSSGFSCVMSVWSRLRALCAATRLVEEGACVREADWLERGGRKGGRKKCLKKGDVYKVNVYWPRVPTESYLPLRYIHVYTNTS